MAILVNKKTVASTISAAIAALPSSGGEIFVGPGTYTVPSTTTIPSNTTIIGSGMGVTILQAGVFTSAIGSNPIYGETCDAMFINTHAGDNRTAYTTVDTNITFENLTLDGNGSSQNRRVFGVGFQYVKGLAFRNVACQNFGQLNMAPDTVNTEALGNREAISILFRNCLNIDVKNCPQTATDGVGIVLSKYIVFEGCTGTTGTSEIVYASDVQYATFKDIQAYNNESSAILIADDHSSSGGYNKFVKLINCNSDTTNKAATYTSWTSPGLIAINVTDLTVRDCTIQSSYGAGMTLQSISHGVIADNFILNNSQGGGSLNGINMITVTDTELKGNNCYDTQGSPTQYIGMAEDSNSNRNTITLNKFSGNASAGFFASNSASLLSERFDNEGMESRYHRRFKKLYNNSGGNLTAGFGVILKADPNGEQFTVTTTAADPKFIGIVAESINVNTFGRVQTEGRFTNAKVNGAIAATDLLTMASSNNRLKKTSTGDVGFGYPLGTNASGDANMDIILFGSGRTSL